jgi:hypothetical protein
MMEIKRNHLKLIKGGADAQLEKLQENDHKEDYSGMSIVEAFRLKEQEVEELRNEIFDGNGFVIENPDYRKIRHEAADNANYDHIIIMECDRKIKELET